MVHGFHKAHRVLCTIHYFTNTINHKTKKMKKTTFLISIGIVALVLSSCSTKNLVVTFDSKPSGAVVKDRKGKTLGVTPCAMKVQQDPWHSSTKVTLWRGDLSMHANLQHLPFIAGYVTRSVFADFSTLSTPSNTDDTRTTAGETATTVTSHPRSIIHSVLPATPATKNGDNKILFSVKPYENPK